MLDKPAENDFADALFYPMDNMNGPCWRQVFDPGHHEKNLEEEAERLEALEQEKQNRKEGKVKEKGMIRRNVEEFVLEKLEDCPPTCVLSDAPDRKWTDSPLPAVPPQVLMKENLRKKGLELLAVKFYLVQVAIREEQSATIFAQFDADGSGFIDRAELKDAIENRGI